ncbi:MULTISPECIES: asparaginase [Clostridia]|uniref:asparaginase n=1 Tax=Clostridia TaxID=186801 RepID=UPI000EA3F12A|nr:MULTISPECIES: asparaginase [Clostridia]NBJ70470.1 asparaginase [Roseburia sp. 1XD42-34]RKI76125.1 asparaginase [Clostridium sp. 1xD42-85]
MKNEKVVLIATGGTIASKKKADTGLLESGVISGEEIVNYCDIPAHIDVQVESMLQKASMHLTFDDLLALKERIDSYLMDDQVSGVVVTQGTDTLEESSYFMNLITNHEKPIVFTGSQRSPGEVGTDAFVNIKHAVLAACCKDLYHVGVVVVFNERIFHSRYVKKEHASNVQGFNSFGFGYLGIIDNEAVHIFQKPLENEYYELTALLPEVDIIKCYMNADDKYIRAAREANVDGIILEGVGRGQVTPGMMSEIRRCVESGITVVITTSAVEGEVYTTYDYKGSTFDLKQAGVILGRDYDSKKARIKLIVGLASEHKDIAALFNPN